VKIKGMPALNFAAFNVETDEHIEAKLEGMREAYTGAINDIIDHTVMACGDDGVLQQHVAQDFALFTVFLVSLKMVEISGLQVDRAQLLSSFNYIWKRQERNVPEQIIKLAKLLEAPGTPPPGMAGHA